MLIFTILALFNSHFYYAGASTCTRITLDEAFQNSEVVAQGKVTKITIKKVHGDHEARNKFVIEKVWKGDVSGSLDFYTEVRCCGTGLRPEKGKTYILFLKKYGGKYGAFHCGGPGGTLPEKIQTLVWLNDRERLKKK